MNESEKKNSSLFDNDPILYATWLYYQDGLSQTEVAQTMGISRVTVVKYLQTAREKGYVNISLDAKSFSSIELAINIKTKFNLYNVIIIPDSQQDNDKIDNAARREHLARAGGMYLSQVVEDNDLLGVAWGRTIHRMGHIMSPKPSNNVTVLQMLGSMPAQPDFTTIESSSLIANKFSGSCVNLHVPAVVSSASLAAELQAEPIIQANFSALNKCNKALFVVGNVQDDNPLIRSGVLSKKEMQTYRDLGAVGVICGRFYDKDGNHIPAEVDLRILGISLAQLRNIKRRIFLAVGEENFMATLGAIRGGYVSDLIIDEATAYYLNHCQS